MLQTILRVVIALPLITLGFCLLAVGLSLLQAPGGPQERLHRGLFGFLLMLTGPTLCAAGVQILRSGRRTRT